MFRELVKVMTGIVITLNDHGSVRRKADVPADKTDLRNDHCRLGAHLYYLIPHRENKALKHGTCHGVLLVKDLGLIYREISDLTGLLINGRSHASVVEIINAVAVIAESAAGTGHMDLAFPLDSYDPYRINGVRIDRTYSRMLYDCLFKEMRTFLIYKALIDIFSLFSFAVDLLNRLAAGTKVSLGKKDIVAVYEIQALLLIVFPDLKPLAAKEFAEALVEFDLIVDQVCISRIVISLNEIIVAASGDICVALFVVEVIHLIEPVIHIACAKLPAAVDHVEKYPHAGLTRLLVDILDLGVHRLIVHARNAPYQIL